MVVVEIAELPRKITWVSCLREPIYGGQHKVVGYIERAKHRAYVKKGFKVSTMELESMVSSD
jgi:hypothetical protein